MTLNTHGPIAFWMLNYVHESPLKTSTMSIQSSLNYVSSMNLSLSRGATAKDAFPTYQTKSLDS